ncbi:MAG: hypothetical protein ACRBK7_02845 [Acidimicrobiales bacterium]
MLAVGVASVFVAAILMAIAERRDDRRMKRAALRFGVVAFVISVGFAAVLAVMAAFEQLS